MRQFFSGYVIQLYGFSRYALLRPPLQSSFHPLFVPLIVFARAHKEFQLHLLELAHAKYKVTWSDLIAERLTDLRNTKR